MTIRELATTLSADALPDTSEVLVRCDWEGDVPNGTVFRVAGATFTVGCNDNEGFLALECDQEELADHPHTVIRDRLTSLESDHYSRLIADMLEALREVPAWFEEWSVEIGSAEETLLGRVNAAIARAEARS